MSKIIYAFAFLVVAASVSPAAASVYVELPGNACQPGFGNTTVFYDDFGAGNQDTVSATKSYMCPLIMGINNDYGWSDLDDVTLRYEDQSTTNEFVCYVFATYYDESQYWGDPLWTCSAAGGCSTSTTSYQGPGWLHWPYYMLPGDSSFYIGLQSNMGIRCEIPKANGANWGDRSWIIGYDGYHS